MRISAFIKRSSSIKGTPDYFPYSVFRFQYKGAGFKIGTSAKKTELAVLSTACLGVGQGYADVTGLFCCNVACMESDRRDSFIAVAVDITLDAGFAVAEIDRADLPAACCGTFDESTLLSFLYLERTVIACFEPGSKIAAGTLDGKALDRVCVSEDLDRGSVGLASDFKGNFGCARFFYTETDVVVVAGISIRLSSISEVFGSVTPCTVCKRIKFNNIFSADNFDIGF